MESSDCPFCHLTVPSSQLQWHANSHFEDADEEAEDLELANQIQIASSSGSTDVDSISSLIALQTRSKFYHVKDGLISLLRNCLELETKHSSSVTILSGYVDHFQSLPPVDVGSGCGCSNIQMLSSHLLAHTQEARQVLFGGSGSGFVPDIVFLQRWLEIYGKEDLIHLVPNILIAKSMVPSTGLGLLNALLFFAHLVFVLGWLTLVPRNLSDIIFLLLVLYSWTTSDEKERNSSFWIWIDMLITSGVRRNLDIVTLAMGGVIILKGKVRDLIIWLIGCGITFHIKG